MPGISVKLPISLDGHTGNYSLNKNYRDVVKQNFKHLMLTSPGERVMDSDFGAGLRSLLFEPDDIGLQAEVTSRVQEQINSYMPYLSITDISFTSPAFNEDSGPHTLSIRLDYEVDSLDIADFLNIEV